MDKYRPIRSTADRRPDTDYEALMVTKPFEEPEESNESLLELREAVAAIVDELDPRSLWIVNAYMSEGKSLQEIADELGITKTHVWRLRNQAYEKLRRVMTTNTTIRKNIRLADSWEESAGQWVKFIHDTAPDYDPITIASLDAYNDAISDSMGLVTAGQPAVGGIEETFIILARRAVRRLQEDQAWGWPEMVDILCSKQHDYGHGNINRFGLVGIAVRLSDKIERFKNLNAKNHNPLNESTLDTLYDIVGYCVIALMLIDETFQLPLGDDYGTHSHE